MAFQSCQEQRGGMRRVAGNTMLWCYPFGSRSFGSVYSSGSGVVTRRASEGVLRASPHKGLELRCALRKTTKRRKQNVKSVIGGIEITRATTTLVAMLDNTSETMNMVINQQSATCTKYNATWRRYCWLLHLKTQNLLSKKWQVTPIMYPIVTATSAGNRWLVIQTMVKSMTATLPPTVQNLMNCKIRS